MILFKIFIGLLAAKLAQLLGSHPGVGLIVGAFFGHFLDLLAYKKFMIWKYRKFHTQRLKAQGEADFLFCFFTLAGKICSSDAKICPKESQKIDEIIKDRFKYKRKERNLAKKYFTNAHNQNIAIQTLASKLVEVLGNDQKSLLNTVYTLREIAEADGHINQIEFKILYTTASVLGLDPNEITSIINGSGKKKDTTGNNKTNSSQNQKQSSSAPTGLNKDYQILGCKPEDTSEKIKRSYRELVAKYHPDKIISKELPQDFIDFAAQRFKEVQNAYESVRKNRGF